MRMEGGKELMQNIVSHGLFSENFGNFFQFFFIPVKKSNEPFLTRKRETLWETIWKQLNNVFDNFLMIFYLDTNTDRHTDRKTDGK